MKRSIVISILIILSLANAGCATMENMSTQERQTLYVVAGVVVGVVAISLANNDSNGHQCHGHGKKHDCH